MHDIICRKEEKYFDYVLLLGGFGLKGLGLVAGELRYMLEHDMLLALGAVVVL